MSKFREEYDKAVKELGIPLAVLAALLGIILGCVFVGVLGGLALWLLSMAFGWGLGYWVSVAVVGSGLLLLKLLGGALRSSK